MRKKLQKKEKREMTKKDTQQLVSRLLCTVNTFTVLLAMFIVSLSLSW